MFRLHEKTRRSICLVGFVLLCILPTAGVLAWCAWRHRPGHVAAEARRLRRELGLAVSLRGVKHPRPGVVLYEGLELADQETGRPVLGCRLLRAQWKRTAGRQGQRHATLVLSASHPEIEAAAADQLGQLLGRMLRGGSSRPEARVELTAEQVALRTGGGSQTLIELRGSLEPLSGGTQASVSFRLAGWPGRLAPPRPGQPSHRGQAAPVRIRVVRNRQLSPPVSGFELDTGGSAVPCGMLAMGLPGLDQLGPRSHFCGYLWANQAFDGQTLDGWDGEVTGQLIEVDLGNLVSTRFPHTLSGTGVVTIQSARFRRGRLEEAAGWLNIGPGVISRSLISAAVQRLHLIEGAVPPAARDAVPTVLPGKGPGALVPYEQFALAVILDAEGLELTGRCREAGLGAILVDPYGRLLSEPVLQPQPVLALLQTLVPAGGVQVPAARQTDWLMRHLPLPEIVAPEHAESALFPR